MCLIYSTNYIQNPLDTVVMGRCMSKSVSCTKREKLFKTVRNCSKTGLWNVSTGTRRAESQHNVHVHVYSVHVYWYCILVC